MEIGLSMVLPLGAEVVPGGTTLVSGHAFTIIAVGSMASCADFRSGGSLVHNAGLSPWCLGTRSPLSQLDQWHHALIFAAVGHLCIMRDCGLGVWARVHHYRSWINGIMR